MGTSTVIFPGIFSPCITPYRKLKCKLDWTARPVRDTDKIKIARGLLALYSDREIGFQSTPYALGMC